MTVEVLNPDGLSKPDAYRHIAIATGSRIVFLAGQVAPSSSSTGRRTSWRRCATASAERPPRWASIR
jgi:hypothetical protein